MTCVKSGDDFGRTTFLTAQGDTPERYALVWSRDGRTLAYNKQVPTYDTEGNRVTTYNGSDYSQIFTVEFED